MTLQERSVIFTLFEIFAAFLIKAVLPIEWINGRTAAPEVATV